MDIVAHVLLLSAGNGGSLTKNDAEQIVRSHGFHKAMLEMDGGPFHTGHNNPETITAAGIVRNH